MNRCRDCNAPGARLVLDGDPLCDEDFDRHVAARTGLPRLPTAPAPEVVADADGKERCFAIRLWRSPGGIVAEAEETYGPGPGPGPDGQDGHEPAHDLAHDLVVDGYRFSAFDEHDGDPGALLERLRALMRRGVRRRWLRPASTETDVDGKLATGRVSGSVELVDGDQVEGRLGQPRGASSSDSGRDPADVALEVGLEGEAGPYDVIVDGRRLTWGELGRALAPFEGWWFRLTVFDGSPGCDDPADPASR